MAGFRFYSSMQSGKLAVCILQGTVKDVDGAPDASLTFMFFDADRQEVSFGFYPFGKRVPFLKRIIAFLHRISFRGIAKRQSYSLSR